MRRDKEVASEDPDQRSPLPPLATGLTLGLWIAVMLILAFGVVPLLFGSCQGSARP